MTFKTQEQWTSSKCYWFFKKKRTRNAPVFSSRSTKTVKHGLQTISYMGPKLLNFASIKMKQVTTLNKFKAEISAELPFHRKASLRNIF